MELTGKTTRPRIGLSPRDREKFGVVSARADEITEENLGEVLKFCREEEVEFLIARCRTTELGAAQALEKQGAILVDTLVLYLRNLVRTPIPEITGRYIIREMRAGEEEEVRAVAAEAFRDYGGHYQADRRLAQTGSEEIYSSWAYQSARNRDADHGVIVAEKDGALSGFTLVQINKPGEGEGTLEGVHPREAKRSLVQRDMAIGAKNWARKRGAARFLASVALTNIVMQKIIIRLGYEPCRSYHTFHLWFDNVTGNRSNP